MPTVLPKYVGTYRDAGSGLTMTVTLNDGTLMSQVTGPAGGSAGAVGRGCLSHHRSQCDADVRRSRRSHRVSGSGAGSREHQPRAHDARRGGGSRSRPTACCGATCRLSRVSPSSDRPAQLARVSWRRRVGQWRRSACRHRVGRREREEHQVEDADPGNRQLEPGDLGRSCVRGHGDQQGRRQHVQDRLVR